MTRMTSIVSPRPTGRHFTFIINARRHEAYLPAVEANEAVAPAPEEMLLIDASSLDIDDNKHLRH